MMIYDIACDAAEKSSSVTSFYEFSSINLGLSCSCKSVL